jgi:hypothetical protein
MKKLLTLVCLILVTGLLQAQDKKSATITYPLVGKFEFRQTQYIQFKEIEFWVYDNTGKLHFYTNHATGTNMPREKIMFSANADYIALMTKNGYEVGYKRNKKMPR